MTALFLFAAFDAMSVKMHFEKSNAYAEKNSVENVQEKESRISKAALPGVRCSSGTVVYAMADRENPVADTVIGRAIKPEAEKAAHKKAKRITVKSKALYSEQSAERPSASSGDLNLSR